MFLKNLATVFTGGFCRSVFLIIQGFVIAKYLGPKSYGIFSLAMSYITLVYGIVDLKISESVIKFLSDFKEKGEKEPIYVLSIAFLGIEVLKVLAAAIIILVTGWIASHYIYRLPGLFKIILVLSLSNLFLGINPTTTAFLRLGGYYRLIAIYDFSFGLFSLLTIGAVVIVTEVA